MGALCAGFGGWDGRLGKAQGCRARWREAGFGVLARQQGEMMA